MKKTTKRKILYLVVLLALFFISRFVNTGVNEQSQNKYINAQRIEEVLSLVGEYTGKPYAVVNDNEPFFKEEEITDKAFEKYGELDPLGRCTYALACVGKETMPTEQRGSISHIYPTGWEQEEYSFVDGKNLYNRCHLIGHQLTGEDDNRENLITGTRYMNVDGMLPFENMIADYIKETGNHVMYRVTPIFDGDNLLASGVLMEAKSVEDEGDAICFNVYCYNVQPGIKIDYSTGRNTIQ